MHSYEVKDLTISKAIDSYLWQTWFDYQKLPALALGFETHLFEILFQEKKTAFEISQILKASARATSDWLHYLVSLSYLRKSDQYFYLNESFKDFLLEKGCYYWGDAVTYSYQKTKRFCQVRRALFTSVNAEESWQKVHRDPESSLKFALAMKSYMNWTSTQIANLDLWNEAEDLLDLGASMGHISHVIAIKNPHLKITLADLPMNVQAVSEVKKSPQFTWISHNFWTDPIPHNYSHILLANIIHDYSQELAEDLIKKISNEMAFGQTLIILDLFQTNFSSSDPSIMAFSLYLAATFGGRIHPLEWIENLIPSLPLTFKDAEYLGRYHCLIYEKKPIQTPRSASIDAAGISF
jgi:hypothetical protein